MAHILLLTSILSSALTPSLVVAPNAAYVEIDHQVTKFGIWNITLGWKTIPYEHACSLSRIVSNPICQQNNLLDNIVTLDTSVTLPSENVRISGELVDFNLSTFGDQSAANCPLLPETIRINVTETETINLLLGNNNCTCVNVQCQGGLYVAISNTDLNQEDILCPVYASRIGSCYDPSTCRQFDSIPFFRICENPSKFNGLECNMCFGNVTEKLNGTRLDFFILNRTVCNFAAYQYLARVYIKSIEIRVSNASADISINSTSGEICFTSSSHDNCPLTHSTLYNVSITDLTGNLVFHNESIPESGCATINDPHCGPYGVEIKPYSNYITYDVISRNITAQFGSNHNLCPCIHRSAQLFLNLSRSQGIKYHCTTLYKSPLDILIRISTMGPDKDHEWHISCGNETGSFDFVIGQHYTCGYTLRICGYFISSNNTYCLLNCTYMMLSCPTPVPSRQHIDVTGIIIGTSTGTALICMIILLMILLSCFRICRIKCNIWTKHKEYEDITVEKNPAYEDVKVKPIRNHQATNHI